MWGFITCICGWIIGIIAIVQVIPHSLSTVQSIVTTWPGHPFMKIICLHRITVTVCTPATCKFQVVCALLKDGLARIHRSKSKKQLVLGPFKYYMRYQVTLLVLYCKTQKAYWPPILEIHISRLCVKMYHTCAENSFKHTGQMDCCLRKIESQLPSLTYPLQSHHLHTS